MTKMKFGIQTSLNNVEWREIEDMWKFLDRDTKFASAWTFDHFVPPGPGQDANANCFEGWSALAALAAVTDRIRLGCLVTGVTYRHPGVLAKQVTTLDVLSGGRAYLGIGAAWFEAEHDGLGVPYPSTSERFERLDECLAIFRQMCSDDEGPFHGERYRHDAIEAADSDAIFYLCDDDLLLPGALWAVAKAWQQKPGSIVAGGTEFFNSGGTFATTRARGQTLRNFVRFWESADWEWAQQGTFLPLAALQAIDGVERGRLYFQ